MMVNPWRYAILFCLAMSLAECSSRNSDPKSTLQHNPGDHKTHDARRPPRYNIAFQKIASYGSTKNKLILVGGSPNDLARVDDKGRVFIPDRKQNTVDILAPDGRYITHLGRKGKGPGEFTLIGKLRINSNYVYVTDWQQRRINVYSLDSLSYSHTINVDSDHWGHVKELQHMRGDPYYFFFRDDGMMLTAFVPIMPDIRLIRKAATRKKYRKKNRNHYYWMNPDGKVTGDEVLTQKGLRWVYAKFHGGPRIFHLPIYGQPLIAVANNGTIFAAWSEDFLIKVYDASGTHRRTIHYAYEKAPINRDSLIKRHNNDFESTLSVVKHRKLPQRWPALHSLKIDDQHRLWVSTIVKDQTVYQWWVLSPKGKLLARFLWPRDKANSADQKRGFICFGME